MDDPAFRRVLDAYRERLQTEEALMRSMDFSAGFARRDEMLLAVGEAAALFLHSLITGLDAKIIVELGTSYGYSTLFLADAARRTGGKVFSYEIASQKQDYARGQIAKAGLSNCVEWRLGDAVQLLADQPGPVDFALIDLWKDIYIPCFNALYDNLSAVGVIAADNMTYPEGAQPAAKAYRAAVRAKPDIQAVLLPIGSGLDLARKMPTE